MTKLIYVLTVFGTVLAVILAFRDPLIAIFTASITVLMFALDYIYENWSMTLRPRELKPQDFMRKIDIKVTKTIKILGHTGGDLFTAVDQKLDEIMHNPEHKNRIGIQVIVRHPKAEVSRRSARIRQTEERVKRLREEHFNIELRFYQDLPAHRGIICEYTDAKRRVYLSGYYWPKWKNNRSGAFEYPMVIRDSVSKPNHLSEMLESWVNHYWGSGKIHTVVFDFDDTLAPTMDIQVDAWIEAIESALERNLITTPELSAGLMGSRSDLEDYRKFVKAIFIEHQMSEQIINEILPNVDRKIKEEIDRERFDIRKRILLERGTLFPGVEEEIKRLRDKYQLAIVTATSSRLVNVFLDRWKMTECFSIILGKDDPKHQWENVHSKAIRLIEVSGLNGVPLDRLIFIGDNNADYEAAQQLGVSFIEAAQTAQSVGKDSLIKQSVRKGRRAHKRFSSFNDRTLEAFIEELNREEM